MDEARAWACRYLGRQITDDEWIKAHDLASQKLDRIIAREGDAEGERLKPYYLGKLAQEAIIQFCWDEELDEYIAKRKNDLASMDSAHKKCGGRSTSETATTTHNRIILRKRVRCQATRRIIACG